MTPPAPRQPTISTDAPRGATIEHAYAARKMKAYPVLETELKTISNLNTQVTTFSSVASALVALAVGIWTNAGFASDPMPPTALILTKFVAPGLCVMAIVFFVLSGIARKSKNDIWEAIDRETSDAK